MTKAKTAKTGFVVLSSRDVDYGVCPAPQAAARAQEIANEDRRVVHTRDAISDELLGTYRPAKPAKAQPSKTPAKPARTAKTPAKAAKVEPAAKPAREPGAMGKKVIQLCLRPQGATPGQLFELTRWHKAPWKWTLSNRKGTGLGDRYGYILTVQRSKDDTSVAYKLTATKPSGRHSSK